MNGNQAANKRTLTMAVGIALCLLIASGAGYRILARRLGSTEGDALLPPGALQRLPLELGDWVGRDVKMDKRIVKMSDTDAHVNRRYVRGNGSEDVSLYIAYGVRIRDLLPHRPEVCYPLNGWTLQDKRPVTLPLGDGAELQCQILEFSRSGLAAGNVTILNYYLADGEYSPEVSRLRSKLTGGAGYVAQVLITCPWSGAPYRESSVKTVSAFAADSTRAVYNLFPRSEEDLKEMWALFDDVLAEYETADSKGYGELMELRAADGEAVFRAKVGDLMRKHAGSPARSTTLPASESRSSALSGGNGND